MVAVVVVGGGMRMMTVGCLVTLAYLHITHRVACLWEATQSAYSAQQRGGNRVQSHSPQSMHSTRTVNMAQLVFKMYNMVC